MQYVRLALEYSTSSPQEVVNATADTLGRKLREMRYALALEKQLTKDQILERYLNMAPFGHGAFGIYAAAEVYFNKSPKDLTLSEAALLAGLVKAPGTDDPMTDEGRPVVAASSTDRALPPWVDDLSRGLTAQLQTGGPLRRLAVQGDSLVVEPRS